MPVNLDASPGGGLDATLAFNQLRAALSNYLDQPGDGIRWQQLLVARRVAGAAMLKLPRKEISAPWVEDARRLVREVSSSGMHDRAVIAEDIALVGTVAQKGWQGLLTAMLLTPAWQWPDAPLLLSVPEWLHTDYVTWLFAPSQGFSAIGDAETYANHMLHRLEELVRWVGRCPGALAEAEVLSAYVRCSSVIPLYFCTDSLRRHAELRGRLLQRLLVPEGDNYKPEVQRREGRRLRVGFINRHFGPQTETYTTLPTFEQLDPERFEAILFSHVSGGSVLEAYCRNHAADFFVLPENMDEQIAMLREANLDIVVFGTNVTAVCNEVTRLALHRVAPLQVVNNSSCITSGLPEVDLYVSGTLTEAPSSAAHFSERLGLLPGPTHAFNYSVDRAEPQVPCTRADFGIPDAALVFVSAANYYKIIPEMQHAWARLLAAVPGSHLLVHPFNPNWSSSYPIKRFRAEFEAVLAAHGVEASRLAISTKRFPSRTDVKTLLGLGNLYLDTYPFGGVNSLVDPLELGLPVVVWEGETFRSRMGAALLRQLGLDELIVSDAEAYHGICVRLAGDAAACAALRARILAAMERAPLFLDTLAASDAFGALLEQAFDELAAHGREAFRRETRPLVAPDAATPAVRQARGHKLLAAGDAARATDYFLGAIQHDERNASLWRALADALRRTDRMNEAVQCLETCLQLDPRNAESWRLLADVAQAVGHAELHTEAMDMLKRLTVGAEAALATRPRVLIYTDDPDAGGVAHYNHSIMIGLSVAGCEVACAQSRSESPLVIAQRELGVAHHWIPYDTKKEFARTIEDQAAARQIIGAAKPDLIVFSDCCPVSNMAARDVAHQLSVPYVVVVGFVGDYLADRFKAVLGHLAAQYSRARAVVAVSQENLDLLHNRFGLPADAGQVIHYGRPKQFFAPRDEAVRARLRAELRLPDDAVVCFTAARLASVKGYLYQILAAKHLVALPGCAKLHFVWAGDGDQRAELEQTIASSGLTGRVHLLGQRWDVADWYDAADIFVLPSDMEGMPLAIMEAMAKGLPVVATAVSGIPEELGDTGQLLPSAAQNRSALVSELIRTLHLWTGNAALRRSVGEAGRARAQAMFRESLMIERTVALVGSQLTLPVAAAVSA